jgi:GcrA cell cycle regulator
MTAGEWTAAEDAKLTEYWDAGWRGRDIAAALGKSKNAVIGRAHRLHLPKRRQVSDAYLEAIRARRKATQPVPATKATNEAAKAERPLVPMPIDTRSRTDSGRLSRAKPKVAEKRWHGAPIPLLWAKPGQCRFPVKQWAGPYRPFMCGAPCKDDLSSYCSRHHSASHVKSERYTKSFEKWAAR